MAIITTENEIINKLASTITTVKVEAFPDNPNLYKLIHPIGAILVAYSGSIFSDPTGYDFFQQLEEMDFSLTLIVKGLRNQNGAYNYIDSIRTTLNNYKPTNCTQTYIKKVDFLEEKDGEWQFGITYKVLKENFIK